MADDAWGGGGRRQILLSLIYQFTAFSMLMLLPLQVRHIGVSNETSYGVMRFLQVSRRLVAG